MEVLVPSSEGTFLPEGARDTNTMANFVELRVKDGLHKSQLINMDLVLEIVPPTRDDYGARLIFTCVDAEDNDFMYMDVLETTTEVMRHL